MLQKQTLQLILLVAALPLAILSMATGCQRGVELGPIASAASAGKIRQAFSTGEASSAGKEVASTSTGWATLKGRFVFDGTPPVMQPYNANKDLGTCTDNGTAALQETVLVDAKSKGLANVVIYVYKAPRVHESAESPESAESKGDSIDFDQKKCVFLTHVFPLTLGQTIAIKNSDAIGHNTNIDGKNGFNQTIPAGATVEFKPQKEESYPVSVVCSIHPWMKAYFIPRKNAYIAVTKADGSFEIPNVPAGEDLVFQVWHENSGGRPGPLVLKTAEAKGMKWDRKGRFKMRLSEGESKELEVVVPASALGV